MEHTARQEHWAAAAREQGSALAAGLFSLLSGANEEERAAGITSSPLEALEPAELPPAEPRREDEPCPNGAGCALNRGARHCKACGRNWPPDETWPAPSLPPAA